MNEQPSLAEFNNNENEKTPLKMALDAILGPAENINNSIKKFVENI
jgi:hypothetical protein